MTLVTLVTLVTLMPTPAVQLKFAPHLLSLLATRVCVDDDERADITNTLSLSILLTNLVLCVSPYATPSAREGRRG